MADSKRERVLAKMAEIFSGLTADDTGGGTTFKRVLDSPYQGREFKGQNVLSILEGDEQYIPVVSPDKLDRALDVELDVHAYVPLGTTLRSGANDVLADIEQVVYNNELWDGLAYATFLQANSVLREDTQDRTVEISVFITVRYRTKRSNPRA